MIDSTWLPTIAQRFARERPSEIVPNVWVGDQLDARAAWHQSGWTVIDVRESDTERDPPSVVRIPLLRKDTKYNAGRRALEEIADAIDAALDKGDQVLVHCWQGMERSPLSVVGWLVLRRDYTLDDAYALLKRQRGAWDRRNWLTKNARRELSA